MAAENEGVGACWIANYDPVVLREALHDFLGTGDNRRFSESPRSATLGRNSGGQYKEKKGTRGSGEFL